ncbi:glycosyltransferase family 2 protein [Pseudalkalibacillus sp. Hm43]|uniref:glycosyltransferase family 2 protein n=1 Tax=Pseudalkalibacillus sp. Hm43 TaxID=3450742 RepID=UPI003F42DCAA
MNEPKVSVITPSYKSSKFIGDTISSVLNQTYKNWEMIIVDDCSPDNSVEVIEEYVQKDSRIKLHQLSENSGAAVARNTAIDMADGKYIAFLDSDDLWLPEKLEKQVRFMEENKSVFSFTEYRIMDEEGSPTDITVKIPKEMSYRDLLKRTVIGCLTVMVNIEETGKVQMPNIRARQDLALWLSILRRGYVAHGIQEELAMYRKVKGSVSSNKFKMIKKNWTVYRDLEKIGPIRSAWYVGNVAVTSVLKNIKG